MIKYFVYVRKSQDRSDRQIMSIEGQVNEIKRFARERGFVIAEILIEQQSAKKPGRPIFNTMIEKLQKGEANGILCWKLNRVARNPVDAGTISWLLQGNVIQAIHSKDRSYLPTDNVLMMQIDFGIANQFIKDLSGDVKRGLRDKANSGWMPQSTLPIGYLHHPEKQKAQKQIVEDAIRFPIVKELWRLMETGAYSIFDIKQMADQMGLVNRKGNPYALNTFSLLFKNPFYYGKFYWIDSAGNKVLHQGKHEPMVNEEVFLKVNNIIAGRNRNSRPQRHFYTYRGLITCGGCNGHVSAERKLQVICSNCKHKYSIITNEICRKCKTPYSQMSNPSMVDRIYYRCTRKINPLCRQKAMSEVEIENKIVEMLKRISIPEELYNWLQERIDGHVVSKHTDDTLLIDSLRRKNDAIKLKLKNVLDLRISGEINSDEANLMKEDYTTEMDSIKKKIFQKENALSITLNDSHSYINLAKNCIERFQNGDQRVKKELTAFFCSNLTIKDKSLYFITKKAHAVQSLMQITLFSNTGGSNLKLAEVI